MGKIESILDKIAWDKSRLIPTIAQDSCSNAILMLAFSSRESLAKSLETREAHYFSRSKNRIWRKGEESGHFQRICEVRIDCDNDAILFRINQRGNACHTGRFSCFFQKIDLDSLVLDSHDSRESGESGADSRSDLADSRESKTHKSPYHILDSLYHTLNARKFADKSTSYTAALYAKGAGEIGKKIIEEAGEVAIALKDLECARKMRDLRDLRDSRESAESARDSSDSRVLDSQDSRESSGESQDSSHLIYESADLLYHLLVALSYENIAPERVLGELARRFGVSGIAEKNSRAK